MSPSVSLSGILTACIIIQLLIGLGIGPVPLSLSEFFAALTLRGTPLHEAILWELRLPRGLAALCVGGALGAAGAALQGLLRNPLAEPGILGVSAFSSMAATLILYLGGIGIFGGMFWGPSLAAIGGALVATVILVLFARHVRSTASLILIGVGFSSFAGAIMALLINLAPDVFTLSDLVNWSLGSLENRSMRDLYFTWPFFALGALLLTYCARPLSVLSLGEETAHTLGIDLQKLRIMIISAAGLLSGAAVALAGVIGFIGLVAPHFARPLVQHDPGRLLIPSALIGANMVLFADILARLSPAPTELRIGVIASLIGAPLFIYIAAKETFAND